MGDLTLAAIRVFAHAIILFWMVFFAVDSRWLGRRWESYLWTILAVERFVILTLLALDVSAGVWWYEAPSWMETRWSITPATMVAACILSTYGVVRILQWWRTRREIRRMGEPGGSPADQ
jgi:hypothetical protein